MFHRSTQLSVFLENKPGELSRMAQTLGESGINILAMSIQDPAEYIQGLFRAREVTLRRIASTASYASILKEAALLTLIRFVTTEPEKSEKVLTDRGYAVNASEVILAELQNRPGELAGIADALARVGINSDYTYGSAPDQGDRALFVFHVSETQKALKVLRT